MAEINDEQIAVEAYLIWERAGKPDGNKESHFFRGMSISQVHWMFARMNLEARKYCSPDILNDISSSVDGWQERFYRGSYKGKNLKNPRKNNNIVIKDGKMIHGGVFHPEIQMEEETIESDEKTSKLVQGWTIEEGMGECIISNSRLNDIDIKGQ